MIKRYIKKITSLEKKDRNILHAFYITLLMLVQNEMKIIQTVAQKALEQENEIFVFGSNVFAEAFIEKLICC